jgi:SAM-dependent methyltransferase
MNAWYEDDQFWEATQDLVFNQDRWNEVPRQVEQIIALAGLEKGQTVLDLCCGVGRHSLELARRGFRVTAVDRTQRYLDQAKAHAEAETLEIEFVRADMREFRRERAFDAALNIFTSFGYFPSADGDLHVLQSLHSSLKPGGQLVMEMVGKEIIARIFRQRDWHEVNGRLLLEERKVTNDWTWIENRWVIIDGKDRRELRFEHRMYSAGELATLLKQVGFENVRAFGDLNGAPYDQDAKRLIVVAR